MGLAYVSTAITAGGQTVPQGTVYDNSHYLVTKYPSNFTSATLGTSADGASIKGFYVTGTIAVTVPAITDPDIASVDVDIASDPLTFAAAVGDMVIAIPLEAMETNARVQNAYVIAADSIRVVFGSLGGNVTGSAKNFKFLMVDLT